MPPTTAEPATTTTTATSDAERREGFAHGALALAVYNGCGCGCGDSEDATGSRTPICSPAPEVKPSKLPASEPDALAPSATSPPTGSAVGKPAERPPRKAVERVQLHYSHFRGSSTSGID